jgi:hypothetical protein
VLFNVRLLTESGKQLISQPYLYYFQDEPKN